MADSDKPTIVKRTVPLTDEQYIILRETFDWQSTVVDMLTQMANKLAEEKAQRERSAWDTIYSLIDMQPGEQAHIDWVNRCVVVTPREQS